MSGKKKALFSVSENSFFTSTSLPSIITYFARPLPVHTPPKPAPWVIPTVLGFFIFQLSDIENLAKNLSPQKLAKISQIYTRKNYFSKKNPQFFSWRGKKTKNKKKKPICCYISITDFSSTNFLAFPTKLLGKF
jgi:hypothetical protein